MFKFSTEVAVRANANPRTHWILLYVFANVIGAVIMYASNTLIGDLEGSPLFSTNALLVATILVCASYIVMLGPIFRIVSKIRVVKANFGGNDRQIGERIGIALIALQLGFMVFNLVTGVNIAGSNTIRTSNPLALIWVLIPVDAVFVIYYGSYRDNRYFFPNLAIWMISNMVRGWSGMLLFVIFFEWCRAYRKNRISWPVIISLAGLGVILYPVLTNIKWIFRLSATSGISLDSFISSFSENFSADDFFNIIGAGIEHAVGRFQVTSLVVETIRLRDYLQEEFVRGAFTPFWLEGLHGIFIQKNLLNQEYLPISVAFTQYGDFGGEPSALGDWNVNIGYVSWFFIAPYLIPIYVAYTVFLGLIAVVLTKWIGWSETSQDMVWLAWLVYLLPPWFGAFVVVLQAMLVFLLMKFIFSGYKKYGNLPTT